MESHNATPPAPAIAPGSEGLDPRGIAERVAARLEADGHLDPRIPRWAPGFDAPFFQAGLAGYSDAAMRLIARRHGCPFCVTEALLDRTLLAGGRGFAKADLGELEENVPGGAEDAPLACQIMGSEPEEMAAAALKAVEQGRRGERAYRALAYAGLASSPQTQHLRLPGGEQLGRVGVGRVEGSGDGSGCDRGENEDLTDDGLTCEDLIDQINRLHDDVGDDPGEAPTSPVEGPRGPGGRGIANVSGAGGLAFATIDVNLACPVKKVSRKARGGHWLAEPEGAIRLLEAVRGAVPASMPCTVKLRRAFDDTTEMAENFHRILSAAMDMGYVWATVHARTVEQKYVGPSRWDLLRELVGREHNRNRRDAREPSVIFGSGDVWNAGDIFRMIAYTGVRGVAVARGCIGNPWIFRQARDLLGGREARPPSLIEQRRVLEDHFRLALAVNRGVRRAELFTGKAMRKFAIRFASHHPEAEMVRRAFIGVDSLESWGGVIERWYPRAL